MIRVYDKNKLIYPSPSPSPARGEGTYFVYFPSLEGRG